MEWHLPSELLYNVSVADSFELTDLRAARDLYTDILQTSGQWLAGKHLFGAVSFISGCCLLLYMMLFGRC